MKKVTFKSYEELPLTLSVPEMAAALGISRAGAYELARTEGFPALKIGTRIVIPKDKLKEWVDTVWHRAFSRSCWQTSRHTASRQKMNGRLVKVGKGEIRNNGKKTRQRRRQYS